MEELTRRRKFRERLARRKGTPLPESESTFLTVVEHEHRELEGPPCPPGFAHLLRFARQLDRMRWFPDGPHPFTPDTIETLARLIGMTLDPLEVEALVQFDHAMRSPLEEDPVTTDKSATSKDTSTTKPAATA